MDWMKWIPRNPTPTASMSIDTGDEVRVWYRILEQGKERFGQFEGVVIRKRGAAESKTFTVRRVTYGEGVERVFPLDSKIISRIEVLRRGYVKRSRLYFLRTAIGKTRIASSTRTEPAPSASPVPIIDKTTPTPPASERPASIAAGKTAA